MKTPDTPNVTPRDALQNVTAALYRLQTLSIPQAGVLVRSLEVLQQVVTSTEAANDEVEETAETNP